LTTESPQTVDQGGEVPAAILVWVDGKPVVVRAAGPLNRTVGSAVNVVPMTAEHATAVLEIYRYGLDSGDASFETTVPTWADWDSGHLPDHRFVAVDREVVGWAAASPVSGRCVYAGVVEHSVYVHPDAQGRGVGALLLDALIRSTEAAGIWTIESGVFPENAASLALHARAGFRVVGIRERIGRHHGRWRDVVLLERRSPHIR
jgi:phosphinothricin acetyltransferase